MRSNGFVDGLPEVYSFIETDDHNIMVMELLGDNLNMILSKNNQRFDLGTVLKLGIEIVSLLEKMHKSNFLHRDIKPNNFVIGKSSNKNKIYVLDLGLSKQYQVNGKHAAFKTNRPLVGTPRYTSTHIHLGIEPSRRDDLESVAYMLIYFLNGPLPWQGLAKEKGRDHHEHIGQIKICANINKLCNGIPACFPIFLKYCRELKYTDEPNYDFIKKLFIDTATSEKVQLKYCWIKE